MGDSRIGKYFQNFNYELLSYVTVQILTVPDSFTFILSTVELTCFFSVDYTKNLGYVCNFWCLHPPPTKQQPLHYYTRKLRRYKTVVLLSQWETRVQFCSWWMEKTNVKQSCLPVLGNRIQTHKQLKKCHQKTSAQLSNFQATNK